MTCAYHRAMTTTISVPDLTGHGSHVRIDVIDAPEPVQLDIFTD